MVPIPYAQRYRLGNRLRKSFILWKRKGLLRGASLETIRQVAQENPIIPVDLTVFGMSENLGANTVMQSYCQLVLTQPDIPDLPEVGNISETQKQARYNAQDWLERLNPRLTNVFTGVKQFCNFYLAFTVEDINKAVDNLDTPDGIREFREIMLAFHDATNTRLKETQSVTEDLTHFNAALESDLTNFKTLKEKADHELSNTYINDLKDQLEGAKNRKSQYEAALWTALGLPVALGGLGFIGAFITLRKLFTTPSGILLLAVVTSALVAAVIITALELQKKMQEAQDEYISLAQKIAELTVQLATLQSISDSFNSLIDGNIQAEDALSTMIEAWATMGSYFLDIADLTLEVLNEEERETLRTQLIAARESIEQLREFAAKCELEGIVPVVSDDTLSQLGLPHSWIGRPINGSVFRTFVAKKRGLKSYPYLVFPKRGYCLNKLFQEQKTS